jgi:hypothetical protein
VFLLLRASFYPLLSARLHLLYDLFYRFSEPPDSQFVLYLDLISDNIAFYVLANPRFSIVAVLAGATNHLKSSMVDTRRHTAVRSSKASHFVTPIANHDRPD